MLLNCGDQTRTGAVSMKFQEDDTPVWAINCQQRKDIYPTKFAARNRLSPATFEWGGLRRDRSHRDKLKLIVWETGVLKEFPMFLRPFYFSLTY
ncbi:hypothetical protein AVEN_24808-1 [Araneus ventricosus]|uniref:Uncharacterized protein n=1 Tax=Araneus ventricosus TaxID=182803 RepID=A0A4Y2BVJ8_ARAVE|nr:hypothetical protein AVEN_24808-1 [Araneus ventricosus]